MVGDGIDPFDVERRLQHDAVGDDRGAVREVAVADVRLVLRADAGRERQHLLHRPAHRDGAQLILHQRRLPGDVHGIDDRTLPGDLDRFLQGADLHHDVDFPGQADGEIHVAAKLGLEPG